MRYMVSQRPPGEGQVTGTAVMLCPVRSWPSLAFSPPERPAGCPVEVSRGVGCLHPCVRGVCFGIRVAS